MEKTKQTRIRTQTGDTTIPLKYKICGFWKIATKLGRGGGGRQEKKHRKEKEHAFIHHKSEKNLISGSDMSVLKAAFKGSLQTTSQG